MKILLQISTILVVGLVVLPLAQTAHGLNYTEKEYQEALAVVADIFEAKLKGYVNPKQSSAHLSLDDPERQMNLVEPVCPTRLTILKMEAKKEADDKAFAEKMDAWMKQEKIKEEAAWQVKRQKIWNKLYQDNQVTALWAQQRIAAQQRQAAEQERQQQAREAAQLRFEKEKEMLPFRLLEEQREANRISRNTLSELEQQRRDAQFNVPSVNVNVNYGQGNVYIKK